MKKYEFKYIDEEGQNKKEYIYVDKIDDIINKIDINYKEVIGIKERWLYFLKTLFIKNKVTYTVICDFCNKLGVLLKSGVTIQKSLDILERQSKNSNYKEKLKSIKYNILEGNTLSYSLKEVGVPSFMYNLIEVGETSGNLEGTLELIYNYYYDKNKIIKIIKKSIYYPIIVSFAMIIAVTISVFKVIPNYAIIFESNGQLLPASTQLLLNISYFINNNIYILLIIIFVSIVITISFFESKVGKKIVDYIKINNIMNSTYLNILNYNFSISMYVLLSSSIDLIKSLESTKNILNNEIVNIHIEEIIEYVKSGMSLSYCLKDYKEFDPILISLCDIGEETGELSDSFHRSSEVFKKNINDFLETLERKIEIVVTVVLGILVGFIMLSIIIPTYTIINTI